MKNLFVAVFISITFASCQPEGRVFIEHQELSPEVEWLKEDTRTFNVPVEDNNKTYNLSLSFRYAYGFQYNAARILLTETSPNGEKTQQSYDLKVRDEKGEYIGEAGYDIWDSEHLIVPNKRFLEKGVYTYTIEHEMPDDVLNFAMEIGVILDEVK